jgi:hypothetical protein
MITIKLITIIYFKKDYMLININKILINDDLITKLHDLWHLLFNYKCENKLDDILEKN